ncbi:hypothetical protein OG599_09155 [Streptomyces sp. NBC_01335]|uniref:hypothetical protein n=1 Tax=Streptomyces sp. NBC_01335 TaxID=2903828 RepID=UPI002E0D6E03|nr:hypothetical protein OG599_09155 [Streptomyces sp. NBC_01335]
MSRRLPIALSALAATSASVAVSPWIAVAAISMPLIVFFGIFMPAVWSKRPARRRDARLLAERILRMLERGR